MHDSHTEWMSGTETRAAVGLSLVFAFRMLGMFMVLPVLATYGQDLAGTTPVLIGLAIGVYDLTQAILRTPLGTISDRIGRHPVIVVGLLIFAAGAALTANADSIWGMIAGRVLQGVGAISAVMMVLLSDLIREQHRTKAMTMIGMSIGVSFAVAMVLDLVLTHLLDLHGLFWFTAGMALVGLLLILFFVLQPDHMIQHREPSVARQALLPTLKHGDLLRLDAGILTLHVILVASFVALPLVLVHEGGLPKKQHWWVYLTALLVGLFGMVPFIICTEKKRRMKHVLTGAVATLPTYELFFLVFGHSLAILVVGTVVFFIAFNLLEASPPSLVSRVSPAGGKDTAMGVYSINQFLGAALGGILGDWMFRYGGLSMMSIGCAVLAALWLAIAATMREPPYVISICLPLAPAALQDAALVQRFRALPDVTDAMVVAEGAAVYIKVDTQQVDRTALEYLAQAAPGGY